MPEELERLGPVGFQDLAAALCLSAFGPGIQVMGAGRDGGRDLYFRGQLRWVEGELWDGYTVFQVKHKATLSERPEANAAWLWSQIKGELDAWAAGISGRDKVPDHLVFLTNVPLTPTPGGGGHDQVLGNIASYIERLGDSRYDVSSEDGDRRHARHSRLQIIAKWRVWDRNQIDSLLIAHGSVRAAFPAFLTVGDVFQHMASSPEWQSLRDLQPAIQQQARAALTGEGLIYFDEAGQQEGGGLPIHQVAIDLPVILNDQGVRTSVVKYVLQRAEHMLKPKVTTFRSPRHLVLTGAPGNGKTTISKFILQVFRAALLDESVDLSRDQRAAIDGVKDGLRRMQGALPRNRRWAVRIDLADYAEQGGLDHESTLIRWIAEQVTARAREDVTPSALHSWMIRWPSILILDGLDEVTEPLLRQRLLGQVTEFVDEAEADGFDCLVVLTTRPVGYTERISPSHFEQIDMDYMSLEEAQRYGELVSQVRLRRDPDRLELLIRRFRSAIADESLRNLLRTPLQVLILTIITENAGTLPPDRYSLFWEYYQTVVKRERTKSGTTRFLLNDHSQHIERLHERVGLRLQVLSEGAERSYAVLSKDELRKEIWLVLEEAGFKPAGRDAALLNKVFLAATQRLVLLAPRGSEGYGFDVRSLQEVMAARCLTTGEVVAINERLRVIAPSPHWRNVLLFGAGRIFAEPHAHKHEALVRLVESLDSDASQRLGRVAPLAPRLALEIVDDGMLRSFPKWRSRLMQTGLKVLDDVIPGDATALARLLVRYADLGDEERGVIWRAFKDAAASSTTGAQTVALLRDLIVETTAAVKANQQVRGLRLAGPAPGVVGPASADSLRLVWSYFDLELATTSCSPEVTDLLARAANALSGGDQSSYLLDRLPDVRSALQNAEAAQILERALSYVDPEDSGVLLVVRLEILPEIFRQPVGQHLYTLMPH